MRSGSEIRLHHEGDSDLLRVGKFRDTPIVKVSDFLDIGRDQEREI
jgi:hypothetical protein